MDSIGPDKSCLLGRTRLFAWEDAVEIAARWQSASWCGRAREPFLRRWLVDDLLEFSDPPAAHASFDVLSAPVPYAPERLKTVMAAISSTPWMKESDLVVEGDLPDSCCLFVNLNIQWRPPGETPVNVRVFAPLMNGAPASDVVLRMAQFSRGLGVEHRIRLHTAGDPGRSSSDISGLLSSRTSQQRDERPEVSGGAIFYEVVVPGDDLDVGMTLQDTGRLGRDPLRIDRRGLSEQQGRAVVADFIRELDAAHWKWIQFKMSVRPRSSSWRKARAAVQDAVPGPWEQSCEMQPRTVLFNRKVPLEQRVHHVGLLTFPRDFKGDILGNPLLVSRLAIDLFPGGDGWYFAYHLLDERLLRESRETLLARVNVLIGFDFEFSTPEVLWPHLFPSRAGAIPDSDR